MSRPHTDVFNRTARCGRCVFFELRDSTCRHDAPRVSNGRFSLMRADDWCGRFSPCAPVNDPDVTVAERARGATVPRGTSDVP